jgi:hypothetical protein
MKTVAPPPASSLRVCQNRLLSCVSTAAVGSSRINFVGRWPSAQTRETRGPTSPNTIPSGTVRSIPRGASIFPYRLARPSTLMASTTTS